MNTALADMPNNIQDVIMDMQSQVDSGKITNYVDLLTCLEMKYLPINTESMYQKIVEAVSAWYGQNY